MSISTYLYAKMFECLYEIDRNKRNLKDSNKTHSITELAFNVALQASKQLLRCGHGKIVFLYGTSCTGKTSICNASKNANLNFVVDGIDAAMDRRYKSIISEIELFKKHFKPNYKLIKKCVEKSDITSYLAGHKVTFKINSSHEDIEAAKISASYVSLIEELFSSAHHRDAAQENLFDNILSLSLEGKNVLVDTVECKDFKSYRLGRAINCPVVMTLVHCSFYKLASFKNERNRLSVENNNDAEARYGTYPFLQFTDFFRPSKEEEKSFHHIDKATAIKIYDTHLQQELLARPMGLSQEDVNERRTFELDVLLTRLGIKDTEESVNLSAQEYFDLEIDTGKTLPNESIKKLLTLL